ncbi:MAG: polymer-forming cytoskeletal protein [Elainellaceae cyanobacterium]
MFWQKRTSTITYLADKTEFQGDVHVDGNLRVDGIVHGNIEVLGDMEIGQSGLVEGAELQAHNLVVHGVVKAHIHIEGRLSISRTGRIEGDVFAKEYDVAPGAQVLGHFSSSMPEPLPESKALPMSQYPEMTPQSQAELLKQEEYRS